MIYGYLLTKLKYIRLSTWQKEVEREREKERETDREREIYIQQRHDFFRIISRCVYPIKDFRQMLLNGGYSTTKRFLLKFLRYIPYDTDMCIHLTDSLVMQTF